jgi:ABC-type glycerol-3-phosphate transport system permease component
VIITAVSVGGVVVLSIGTGYGLSKVRWGGAVAGGLLVFMVVPWVIYLLPIFLAELALGMLGTYQAVIVPYIALNVPLGVLIMWRGFRVVPREIVEAARLDGAGEVVCCVVESRIAKGSIAAVVIVTFIQVWAEFLFAETLLQSSTVETLAVGIINVVQRDQALAFGPISAASVVLLVPAIGIFLVLQRAFERGMLEGAVKG